MTTPKFILTRFTHGSAGKFLSTVLQTSDKIDHWSVIVQSQKNTNLYQPVTLEYVRRSFPIEHSRYLRAEPMVPYNTDLYSVGHYRGNDVTIDQYISNAVLKNDFRLLSCIDRNQLINLIFHKPTVPVFCQGSLAVSITVTSEIEKQWLYKTLWSKHFLETATEIRYLPSDPGYCSFQSLPTVLRFDNQYCFPIEQKDQLYQEYVINTDINDWYFHPEKFKTFDTAHQIRNVFVSLSELMDHDKFKSMIPRLFNELELEISRLELINSMHKIWLERQICL